jgi:hypothetical protein
VSEVITQTDHGRTRAAQQDKAKIDEKEAQTVKMLIDGVPCEG